MLRSQSLAIPAWFCMLLLQGCGITSATLQWMGLKAPPNALEQIHIDADPDCNHNLPVAMDIVFVQDENLAGLLKGLDGPTWFQRKRELTRRYGTAIQLLEFEVVPLTIRSIDAFPAGHAAATNVLLFANYVAAEGQYVAELATFTQLKIVLKSETYQLQELAGSQD